MRTRAPAIVLLSASLSACGSGDGAPGSTKQTSSSNKTSTSTATSQSGAFSPPPLAEGYTRFEAATVTDIQPGDDTTHCQYVMAPLDHDADILDVRGAQSKFGHHAVAFSYTPSATDQVGSEIKCMMGNNEFSASAGADTMDTSSDAELSGGGYLGGVSPAGGVAALPDGVAFRLKKGQGIMLNVHYINTGDTPIDGNTYMDLKLADADPSRLIAAMFLNLNLGFSIPPQSQTDSNQDCVAMSDVNIIMMSNHMHEYGIHGSTQVTRADGTVEMLRDDPTWTSDMVNNPTFARWTVDDPFVLHSGDTIRTSCTWNNTTTDTITFPREMCISAGFALASGDNPSAPTCFNGTWVQQGI
ncbi:MAG TPA: hypothetical protein VHC69_36250 [Polyangiaceae bacterium]|nr:hypothetical protein [Polyangiaceae bacterium]